MKQAMIFAAGKGSRLKQFTANKPKAMVEVRGKTLLQHAIEKVSSHGFCDIIINTHHYSEQIIDFVKNYRQDGVKLCYSDESNMLLDNGGGLKKAAAFFTEDDFLLYNVDILTNIDLDALYNKHLQEKALATLAVRNRSTNRYLLFNNNNELCGWENMTTKEKKIARSIVNAEQLAFSGIHIASRKLLNLIVEEGTFSIIDLYLRLAKNYKISAYKHNDSLWMDTGTPERLKAANNNSLLFK